MWAGATDNAANRSDREKTDLLFALPVPFAARERDFDDAGGEGHEQRVTPAVDLHADDAFVLHAVDAAPARTSRVKHWEKPHWLYIVLENTHQRSIERVTLSISNCKNLVSLTFRSFWKWLFFAIRKRL